jgi:hypothetical protein
MAYLEVARNDIADPRVSQDHREEILEVAAMACSVARHACAILDEGRHLEIEIEVPGWSDSVAVASPERPGAVRGAVERLLRDCGLPR